MPHKKTVAIKDVEKVFREIQSGLDETFKADTSAEQFGMAVNTLLACQSLLIDLITDVDADFDIMPQTKRKRT